MGVETGIPASLQDAFRITGTSHIVAISGFNISIVVGIVAGLLKRLTRRGYIPLTIAAVAVYTLLAGADALVVRAALMGSMVLVAGGFNRPTNGMASLAAAAFIMTLANPGTASDVGFQLSAAATLGLILYAEPFTNAARNLLQRITTIERANLIDDKVGEFSILTLAAQVTTLPLIVYYFHQLSLISLLANLIVLPVQPAVMILGGVATLVAMVVPVLGGLVMWLAWPFLTFTIVVIEALARVPLAGLTWVLNRPRKQRPAWLQAAPAWGKTAAIAGLAIATLAAWSAYLQAPDGRLHITFINVG